MYADAKISDPDQLRNNPLKGALKLVATNNFCIGYAGRYLGALDAIRNIQKQKIDDFGQVTEHLLEVHRDSGGEVDFLIAVYIPTLMLIRIKGGDAEMDLESTWIGDPDAFAAYQELYHSITPVISESEEQSEKYEIISKMSDALSQLVREGKYESVGDFTVSVRSSSNGFKYLGNAMVFPAPQQIPSGIETAIKFGTAQQGGYAYSVLCSLTPNVGAIGVHFHQGNIGALYHPLESDEAIVYSGVTFETFKDLVEQNYGLKIDGVKIS